MAQCRTQTLPLSCHVISTVLNIIAAFLVFASYVLKIFIGTRSPCLRESHLTGGRALTYTQDGQIVPFPWFPTYGIWK